MSKIGELKQIGAILRRKLTFFGSIGYWERRYHYGGRSGEGSYGELARFKAEIINDFVKEHHINTVIDFGCGDGNQLSFFQFPKYTGLDVSKNAIELCREIYRNDPTKAFLVYDPKYYNSVEYKSELALSLDVIYHLVEDMVFSKYMSHIFASAEKFVIIYSSNTDENKQLQYPHVRHRKFTDWIDSNLNCWELLQFIPNKISSKKSPSDFYVYQKLP